jgi:hypothetical protein
VAASLCIVDAVLSLAVGGAAIQRSRRVARSRVSACGRTVGLWTTIRLAAPHGTLNAWGGALAGIAHNEIHTHLFGFDPEPNGEVRERERKVHTELPLDARSAAYVINSAWPMCYQVMIGVAEGRRP